MQFKDAAYEVLTKAGRPLHYKEICKKALEEGILDTAGDTPESSMGAMLYTDTLRSNSRFRRGDKKGTFTLKTLVSGSIQQQIEALNSKVRKELRNQLSTISPPKFEELIRLLLDQMGFEETETTPYSNDKGVDVRGILRSNPLSEVKIAIQAKRWTHNVGAGVVRDLRGSLMFAESELGLIITPGGFSAGAIEEAHKSGKIPISLIDGAQLVDLLINYNVGIKNEEYIVPVIDTDYWTEVLGVSFETSKPEKVEKKANQTEPFPISIEATHNGLHYIATMLNAEGLILFNGTEYQTPTSAAKSIVTDWKAVNGWDFWRFSNKETGKLEKIGKLKTAQK